MNVRQLINQKQSVRMYDKRAVDQNILQQILDAGNDGESLYPSIDTRFICVENSNGLYHKLSGYVGYLGNIMEAPYYIFTISHNKQGYLENVGYMMEQLMLKASSLGIGTCWISIMKYQDKIEEILNIHTGEKIVALTPLGYEKESKAEKFFNELIFREPKQRAVKKEIREFVHSYRLNQPMDDLVTENPKLMDIFNHVRRAPSWANEQPWLFIVTPSRILFVVKKDSGIFGEAVINYNRIDGGIAMLYYSLLARENQLPSQWDLKPLDAGTLIKEYGITGSYEYLGRIAL